MCIRDSSYDIHDVVDACKYYFAQTGSRVTFEYSLVGGVNDTAEDAAELSALVHGMNCHINLITVNPIKERDYVQSNKGVIEAFKNRLEKNGINVTIRREMGRDIDGACGQLRKKHIDVYKRQTGATLSCQGGGDRVRAHVRCYCGTWLCNTVGG